jgi:hypothetical protein
MTSPFKSDAFNTLEGDEFMKSTRLLQIVGTVLLAVMATFRIGDLGKISKPKVTKPQPSTIQSEHNQLACGETIFNPCPPRNPPATCGVRG